MDHVSGGWEAILGIKIDHCDEGKRLLEEVSVDLDIWTSPKSINVRSLDNVDCSTFSLQIGLTCNEIFHEEKELKCI